MNKQRVREIAKVGAASVLSIFIFSAALMGINHAVFAMATNTPTPIEQSTQAVTIPDNLPPEGFQAPEQLSVIESPWQHYHEISAQAMSIDDAALIGAEYIWEMFGVCIDGMTVEMHFAHWPSHTRSYWMGSVYAESSQEVKHIRAQAEIWSNRLREAADSNNGRIPDDHPVWDKGPDWISPVFTFTIDAVTGERIDISRSFHGLTIRGNADIRGYLTREEHMRLQRKLYGSELAPEQLFLSTQTVTELAQKHFNNSTVVNVELSHMNFIALERVNGELVVTDYLLIFNVTDDTGRVADVLMTKYSSQVFNIITQHNDIIPGFRYHNEHLGVG